MRAAGSSCASRIICSISAPEEASGSGVGVSPRTTPWPRSVDMKNRETRRAADNAIDFLFTRSPGGPERGRISLWVRLGCRTRAFLISMGRVHLIDAPLCSQRLAGSGPGPGGGRGRACRGAMRVVVRGWRSRTRPLVYCRPGAPSDAPERSPLAGSPGMGPRCRTFDPRAAESGLSDDQARRRVSTGAPATHAAPVSRALSRVSARDRGRERSAILPNCPEIAEKTKSKRGPRYVYRDRTTGRLLGAR